MINIFQPALGAEELEAVRRVFASNWVGQGDITDQFESSFASYIGVKKNLIRSVSCCTEGLFQSMSLLGIGPSDEVILPSISFVGAANAVASSGAQPVFCDVDKRTLNATAEFIEAKITPKTKAVMILHYGGLPCQMDEICELLTQQRIALIEDSAISTASRYSGKACGTFGDIGIWSFDAAKLLVTGDGGMIYCNTGEMSQRLERNLYLGLMQQSGLSNKTKSNWWEFEISTVGRRAIMNDIAAAIGIEQLKKLAEFIARRRHIHNQYNHAFSGLNWLQLPPDVPDDLESSYYLYWIQTTPETRDHLALYLRENNIYTTFRYYPLHWVSYYDVKSSLKNAEAVARSTLCLPLHQSLSDKDVEKIVMCIRDFGKLSSL